MEQMLEREYGSYTIPEMIFKLIELEEKLNKKERFT